MNFSEIYTRPTKSSNQSNRIEFIDLAKGICILLVLILHSGISTGVWVNHLRMPLYFVLSGLFFKDYSSIVEFLRKKTNNILIPFLAFYVIGLLYGLSIDVICHNDLSIYRWGIPGFVHDGVINNYALWFLLTLFWSNVVFWCIYSLFRIEILRLIAVCVIASLASFVNKETGYSYLSIGAAFMNLPFFYLGFVLKKSNILYGNSRGVEELMGGVYCC